MEKTFLAHSFLLVSVFYIERTCDAFQTYCGTAVFPSTGLCYMKYTGKKAHDNATRSCNEKGGTLLKLEAFGLWDFVKKELSIDRNTPYYIGIGDKNSDGTFLWFDGTPVTVHVRVAGSRGNCVLIRFDALHDYPCNSNEGFICQFNVTCSSPPDVSDTTKSGTNNNGVYLYNSTVNYTCNHGYHFEPSVYTQTAICGDRVWGNILTCTIRDCGPPPNLTEATLQGKIETHYNAQVKYDCLQGYKLNPSSSTGTTNITCEINSSNNMEWSPFTAECIPKSCPEIPILANGTTQGSTQNTFGSSLTYICDLGFIFSTLIPDLLITCQLKSNDSGDVEWSLFTDSCIECSDGFFGINCTDPCGNCLNPVCNKASGECDSQGCQAGYKGTRCKEVCPAGFYGENCAVTCGQCLTYPCNRTSGECLNGKCKDGYKGTLCKNKYCAEGKYGPPVCDKDCGHCKDVPCNEVTGVCDKGCELGYTGEKCDITSNHTEEMENTEQEDAPLPIIGGAGGGLLMTIILMVVIVVLVRQRRRRQSRKKDDDKIENDMNLAAKTSEITGSGHYEEVKETNGSLEGIEVTKTENKIKKNENINMKAAILDKAEKITPNTEVLAACGSQEDLYENTSKKLKVEEIEGYVKDIKSTEDGFENEFRKIPSEKLADWIIGSNPELKPKNRFRNILPYDHSRVHLKETPGVKGSDYINASHINGYKSPRKYIATQGPMDRTVEDFWRMIWEQNVTRIVMLANIFEDTKKKCEKYWPDNGQTETKGKFTINNEKEENFKGFVVRTMKLSMVQDSGDTEAIYNNEVDTTRTVIQFHFTDWPDKGVPMYCTALVSFHRKVKAMSEKVNSPIVVHCSAGIGRTGTYIALDNLTDQCHAVGVVDVFQCVVDLRKDRYSMVQTKNQYVFLYETLFESLTTGVTLIPCYKFTETYEQLQKIETGKTTTGLDAQYKILKAHIQRVLKERSLEGALNPENEMKNRSQETLPGDDVRVHVMLDEPGRNRYINAVFAENYFRRNGLHLTQLPLADTVVDFWRMVQGYNVNTIVSLSNPQEEAFKTSKFWPAATADKVISGPFTITRKDMSQKGTVECCHLSLSYKNDERDVFLVSVSNWADDKWMPRDMNTMYDIYDNVQTWQQGHISEGQTVIQCNDGGMKSGMYAVVSWMFDMINSEQEVDIFQITKEILIARPGFLTKMDQYKDLYKIAQDYMDKFQNYSNFK